jgi:hypothetical protein
MQNISIGGADDKVFVVAASKIDLYVWFILKVLMVDAVGTSKIDKEYRPFYFFSNTS